MPHADGHGVGLVELGEVEPVVGVGDDAEVRGQPPIQLGVTIGCLLVVRQPRIVDGERAAGERTAERWKHRRCLEAELGDEPRRVRAVVTEILVVPDVPQVDRAAAGVVGVHRMGRATWECRRGRAAPGRGRRARWAATSGRSPRPTACRRAARATPSRRSPTGSRCWRTRRAGSGGRPAGRRCRRLRRALRRRAVPRDTPRRRRRSPATRARHGGRTRRRSRRTRTRRRPTRAAGWRWPRPRRRCGRRVAPASLERGSSRRGSS